MNAEKMTAGKTAKGVFMNKKLLFLGMLVMVLAFGMTVVGCGEEDKEYPAELKVTNSTSVEITLVELRTKAANAVVKSDRVGIPAGQSRTYKFDSDFLGSAKIELSPAGVPLVECTINNLNLYIGYDKGNSHLEPAKQELLVSGSILSGFELSIIQ
jgi:hypothetical protein